MISDRPALDRPALVVHGHFYQPPRENPWTGIVEREPSAAPFHDWNDRIHHECYRRNGFARILDDRGRVARIVNNYAAMSFNFGPTLLSWLARERPGTMARLVEADRQSAARRGGHGNAIAQAYGHAILPLCNDRDLRTQICWGIGDFRQRFGREPEALWLPETACEPRVLDALIDQGLRYALLAPGQAARVRKIGETSWSGVEDGGIDPSRPYRYVHRDGSGRAIALFFYDGPIARAVAFEGLLRSSQWLVDRFVAAGRGAGSVMHIVTDGESYGHHYQGGERCLAYTLEVEAARRGFLVTNYGALLDWLEPGWEVELKAGEEGRGTSWSCGHGVGRWMRDCGCHTGGRPGWNQRWRTPLRAALDLLRDDAAAHYEQAAGELCEDPWAVRDAYIELLGEGGREKRAAFFAEHCRRRSRGTLSGEQRVRLLELCEMQRSALLMYTSCGWYFADPGGIETVQILRYAGRLMDQLEELGAQAPRDRFLEVLAEAQSNVAKRGNGADIFRRKVVPARVTKASLAAHVGISSLPGQIEPTGEVAGHRYRVRSWEKRQKGRLEVAVGRVGLERLATGARSELGMAVVHFGGVDVYCVLRPFAGKQAFEQSRQRLWSELERASLLTVLRIAQEEFGADDYGLEHVLPHARDRVAKAVFGELLRGYAHQYAHLYEDNASIIGTFHDAGLTLPPELRVIAEVTLSRRFEQELERAHGRHDAGAYREALALAEQAERGGYRLEREGASRRFAAMLDEVLDRICAGLDASAASERSPRPLARQVAVSDVLELIELGEGLGIELDLDRAQERIYDALGQGLERTEAVRLLLSVLGLSEQVATS
ncbi:MAG: DUF3536 domain-containing protein [Deltaproteobacteria bacterium]|nr:DUF3536 domain-containing protein [Deltaproteobacteria bacterium]